MNISPSFVGSASNPLSALQGGIVAFPDRSSDNAKLRRQDREESVVELATAFDMRAVPVISTSMLKGAQISVLRLNSDNRSIVATSQTAVEPAFVVTLQLRDLPHAELWAADRLVSTGPLPEGSVGIVSLEDEPAYYFPASFDCMQFHIPQLALRELAERYGLRTVDMISIETEARDDVMRMFANLILPLFEQDRALTQRLFDHVVIAVCSHLFNAYGRTSPRTARERLAPWQERACKRILAEELGRRPQIKSIAKACKLSVKGLTSRFRETTGTTMARWQADLRVEAAKRLMFATSLSLCEVAFECGYADQSHFTRSFRDHVGVPPGIWRKARWHASRASGRDIPRASDKHDHHLTIRDWLSAPVWMG